MGGWAEHARSGRTFPRPREMAGYKPALLGELRECRQKRPRRLAERVGPLVAAIEHERGDPRLAVEIAQVFLELLLRVPLVADSPRQERRRQHDVGIGLDLRRHVAAEED